MPDTETPTETNPNVLVFDVPNIDGEHSFDCATIPANVRLDFLKDKTRSYFVNRVNSVVQRHAKDDTVLAWGRYNEAVKADPLQSTVAKPTTEAPAMPDLKAVLAKAMEDLAAGNVRKMGTGEKKARVQVDPTTKYVTQAVVRDVYNSKRAGDPKYTYPMAAKEVGKDGIAYLNATIEAKVAQGVDRAALEKVRDTKYINPAKIMAGATVGKGMAELPDLL